MDKKVERIINIYNRLSNGEVLVKSVEASRFEVNERSIQRDLDDIRAFFANNPEMKIELVYDRVKKGYVFVRGDKNELTSCEVMIVCKILLESRALSKHEMNDIIDKLLKNSCPYSDYKKVFNLVANEKFHYPEIEHRRESKNVIWDMAQAIDGHRIMFIEVKNADKEKVQRIKVRPVGLMFSDNSFYLYAFLVGTDEYDVQKDIIPDKYKLDLIDNYEILGDRFSVVYSERFEAGKFRMNI